jgi:hypothetical protein
MARKTTHARIFFTVPLPAGIYMQSRIYFVLGHPLCAVIFNYSKKSIWACI